MTEIFGGEAFFRKTVFQVLRLTGYGDKSVLIYDNHEKINSHFPAEKAPCRIDSLNCLGYNILRMKMTFSKSEYIKYI